MSPRRLHGQVSAAIDHFNTHSISAFVTAGREPRAPAILSSRSGVFLGTRFLILHESKHDEHPGITKFFQEVYDLYLKAHCTDAAFCTAVLILCLWKVILNPFYEPNTEIKSPAFDQRVKNAMKKHLPL